MFWIARVDQRVYVVRSETALGAARLGARRHYDKATRITVRKDDRRWLATAIYSGRAVAFGLEVSPVLEAVT